MENVKIASKFFKMSTMKNDFSDSLNCVAPISIEKVTIVMTNKMK